MFISIYWFENTDLFPTRLFRFSTILSFNIRKNSKTIQRENNAACFLWTQNQKKKNSCNNKSLTSFVWKKWNVNWYPRKFDGYKTH